MTGTVSALNCHLISLKADGLDNKNRREYHGRRRAEPDWMGPDFHPCQRCAANSYIPQSVMVLPSARVGDACNLPEV